MEFQRLNSLQQQVSQQKIKISPEEVQSKLLERFEFLKQEGGLRQIYSSYDFRLEENSMKDVWEKILDFLLTDVFNTYGITMSDLKKYAILKNKIPVGLNNLIQEFRIEQKYITDEDLKNINFYQINFPELYPRPQGYVSSFLGTLKSIVNFTGTKIGCKEESDNNDNIKIRTDISDEDKYKTLPDNQIIFNYDKFKNNCNIIMAALNDILLEEDNEIISTNNFIKILKERYMKENNKKNDDEKIEKFDENLTLPYGITYLDYILYYLHMIKKINIFKIDNKNIEFIKLLKSPAETVTKKDEAIAKTLSEMELLEKRISDYEKKIESLTEKARIQLSKGNKQSAKTLMIKKRNYLKILENSQNTLSILDKQIIDLKNVESNANFAEILKSTVEVGKQIKVDVDDLHEVMDDITERKDAVEEIRNGIKEMNLNNEEDDEDIMKELEELENENKKKKNIKKQKKEVKDANEDEWDTNQFKGMKKKTYDPGRRSGKKKSKKNLNNISSINNIKNILNEQFSATNYVKKSEGLSIAGKNEYGNKKTNQDTFIIEKNVNGVLNFNIFGVLDGHGDDGHFVSQFVSRFVVHKIKNHPLIKKLDEPKKIYNQLISNGYEIIANIYLDADVQIQKEKFNVTRSGTTIVLVIQLEEHIICANTGDSRAIAIYDDNYEDKDNLVSSKIFPLSFDCKPNLPSEMKRIIQCGGVVEKAEYSDDEEEEEEDEDPLPYRVWAKGEDYPGLAMSRSIGDMDAKKVGVIPNPQIVEYKIDYFSKYILLASDGIWEFISNEEAMSVGNKYYLRNDPKGLCHELTQKAIKLWEKKDVVIDDITIIVVFF